MVEPSLDIPPGRDDLKHLSKPRSNKSTWKIVSLDEDHLVVRRDSGATFEYNRKKKSGPVSSDNDDEAGDGQTRPPGRGRDNTPSRPSGRPQGGNAYQKGYKLGYDAAKAVVDLSRATNQPLDRAELTKQAEEFKETCATIQGVAGGSQEEKDMVRGYYDGMKAALGE